MSSRLKKPGLAIALVLALGARAGPCRRAQGAQHLQTGSDYIADDTVANFEKETGIKVNYDNYDSNEILQAKLVAGQTGYDIVVPGSHFAKTQIAGGLFQKLDRSQLTNWGNLDKGLLKQLAAVDPGNQYLVDWMWGYVTVGINSVKVKAATRRGAESVADAGECLEPVVRSEIRLQAQGVRGELSGFGLRGAAGGLALRWQAGLQHRCGRLPGGREDADLDPARRDPFLSSSGYINDLASGQLCAVMGYSGDINIARARAIAANPKAPPAIEALIPSGGATLFFDTMAIPKDAPHPENALKWINYILRPEVAAALTDKVFYANPNAASLKFVKKDVADNKTIFLSEADQSRMTPPDALAARHPPGADPCVLQFQGGSLRRPACRCPSFLSTIQITP